MISRAWVSAKSMTDWIMRRSSSSTTPRSVAMSTTSRSSISSGERAVAEALARGDGVAGEDEQSCQRLQQDADACRTGALTNADRVGVLAAEGARPTPTATKGDHRHQPPIAASRPPPAAPEADQCDGGERRCRGLADDPDDDDQCHIGGALLQNCFQSAGAPRPG